LRVGPSGVLPDRKGLILKRIGWRQKKRNPKDRQKKRDQPAKRAAMKETGGKKWCALQEERKNPLGRRGKNDASGEPSAAKYDGKPAESETNGSLCGKEGTTG